MGSPVTDTRRDHSLRRGSRHRQSDETQAPAQQYDGHVASAYLEDTNHEPTPHPFAYRCAHVLADRSGHHHRGPHAAVRDCPTDSGRPHPGDAPELITLAPGLPRW